MAQSGFFGSNYVAAGGGANPVFGSAVSGSAQGSGGTSTSGSLTTSSGNSVFVYWSMQTVCSGFTGGASLSSYPTYTGATFKPVVPASGGGIIGVKITNAGSGFTTDPTANITYTGGGSGAGITLAQSGGLLTTAQVNAIGTGINAPVTLSVTGGGGTGATIEVSAYGIGSTLACTVMWQASNVSGGTGTVSFTHPAGAYHGIAAIAASGLSTSNSFDTGASGTIGSSASVNSSSFSTASAAEMLICGTRVEALSQTFTGTGTACSGAVGGVCTVPAASVSSDGFQGMFYGIYSGTQSGVVATGGSGTSQVRSILCGVFK